ncbi:MAG TPA: YbhB/YbcL family Raf kinase inhibitor-like protein [Steroidobacteraceae bacterium]|nr:YbhB/YbcL family Raf kinase inhibitor-like protein [Steroidobacteraceae bacterium]
MRRSALILSGGRTVLMLAALAASALARAGSQERIAPPPQAAGGPGLSLRSPGFAPGDVISSSEVFDRGGCRGGNSSPALQWSHPPAGTRSFALLLYDSDAPGGFWHWAVFDIPARVRSLQSGAGDPAKHLLPSGAIQVRNDFGSLGYGGPCPPPGPPHHYHLMLYALRHAKLGLGVDASPARVADRARADSLAEAQLVGRYAR